MYLQIEDLKNNIYNYQVEQITQGDESIVLQALDTAEQEVKSYFYINQKKEFLDGRKIYDVDKTFSAKGNDRNALLVSLCLSVAKWYIVDLCNADIIYQHANKGEISLGNIPTLQDTNQESPQKENIHNKPFSFGSRNKFNHE